MKTTAILNLKGGVGKTVTAINAAAILAGDYGRSTLVIDADSQCNTTDFLLGGAAPNVITLAELLRAAKLTGRSLPENWGEVIVGTELEKVDLICGSDQLMDLDLSAVKTGEVSATVLRDLVAKLEQADLYKHVLIDCPPAFNAASAAALVAADEVIIPIKLDAFAIQGMANLLRQINNMRKINPGLRVAGLLPTMWYMDPIILQVEDALRKKAGVKVFTPIRRSDKVNRMTFEQEPLRVYSPRSAAGIDYRAFVREWLEDQRFGGGAGK